jgi:hypothetical protein
MIEDTSAAHRRPQPRRVLVKTPSEAVNFYLVRWQLATMICTNNATRSLGHFAYKCDHKFLLCTCASYQRARQHLHPCMAALINTCMHACTSSLLPLIFCLGCRQVTAFKMETSDDSNVYMQHPCCCGLRLFASLAQDILHTRAREREARRTWTQSATHVTARASIII